jgi:uncharacterized protein YndB with AHSA1/START domain
VNEDYVVEVVRVVPTNPARLFQFWTSPTELIPFLGLSRGEVDARVGGKWFWAWTGEPCGGEFTAVEQPNRLAFTFSGWGRDDTPTGLTQMEIRLDAEGDATRMTIRHVLNGPEVYDDYVTGWTGSSDAVVDLFSKC